MEEKYLIWHGRHGGWLTNAATYSSQLGEARHMSRQEAIEMSKLGRGKMPGLHHIPVRLSDITEVMQ